MITVESVMTVTVDVQIKSAFIRINCFASNIPHWWEGCSESLVCILSTHAMSTRGRNMITTVNKWLSARFVQNFVPHNHPVSWSIYPLDLGQRLFAQLLNLPFSSLHCFLFLFNSSLLMYNYFYSYHIREGAGIRLNI